MTKKNENRDNSHPNETDGRRRQLRLLLLSAANAARRTRQLSLAAARAANPMGRAVRDRVSTLLIAC